MYGPTGRFVTVITAAGGFVAWLDPRCGECPLVLTDIRTGRDRRFFPVGYEYASFSPDGRHIAVGAGIGPLPAPVVVIDLRTGRVVWRSGRAHIAAITWTPDSHGILYADAGPPNASASYESVYWLTAHRLGTNRVTPLGPFVPEGAFTRT
jgi:hypothetical protein